MFTLGGVPRVRAVTKSEMEDALRRSLALLAATILTGTAAAAVVTPAQAATKSYDITTLAGKVASVNGTAGLQIRFSAFIEEEAEEDSAPPVAAPISPPFVLGSPLDGTSVQAPNVTVNQDTAGAPQNETAIAVARMTTSPAPGRARSPERRAARWVTAIPAPICPPTAGTRGAARPPTRITLAR
jgi:hypothetical protein